MSGKMLVEYQLKKMANGKQLMLVMKEQMFQ